MVDVYSLANSALDALPDNIHLGHENTTIVFEIEGDVTGTDRLGNPIRSSTTITVEGRAVEVKVGGKEQILPGTSNKYLPLKVNVTKVDGVATTTLPTSITPLMTGSATYTQSNGQTMIGEFQRDPSLSKTIGKIHQKVGDIMYGMLEVTGDGR